jgi:SAM-dependent methyltransferase
MSEHKEYVGELAVFSHARRWKRYLRKKILPHLKGNVLEVGAGNGINAAEFLPESAGITGWTSLEPDHNLAEEIRRRKLSLPAGNALEVKAGTSESLGAEERFDSILYVDVLEHIDDDRGELERAARHLKRNGRLVILSPAHQFLFSPLDASVGHFRRYDRGSLEKAVPASLRRVELSYLDSFGMLASLANRLLLKETIPSARQIWAWDRLFVPVSTVFDPVLGYRLGKSLLGVWENGG